MDEIVDGSQSHGTDTGENGEVPTLLDAHVVDIASALGVIVSVESAGDAAQGFGERAREIALARNSSRQSISITSLGITT